MHRMLAKQNFAKFLTKHEVYSWQSQTMRNTMIDYRIILKAIKIAKKSNCLRSRMAAIVFTNNGRILTHSDNKHFFGHKKKFTIHAEEGVLAKIIKMGIHLRFKIKDLNILVVRWKPSTDALSNAKPCPKCAILLKRIGIRTFHSDENGDIKKFIA